MKTSNILLNHNLEAKIADFGLSKAFQSDVHSYISTGVVGTPGYVDPEYVFLLNFFLSVESVACDVLSCDIV